ncbi:DUF6390 family protein [Pseudonocardia sp.]|uniref:DUF6390 family protein n=1 Tax=Pseudonocardia sp. TaxID=60912 RepID=UPI003D0A6EFB
MTAAPAGSSIDTRGTEFFARYAYAPNQLGYCGPPEAAVLRSGSPEEIRAVARRFSGAWPYLQVLARMTGIADPMDHRVVESYWLGGGIGAELDAREFGQALLDVIGPQAGHYWAHLTPALLDEAAGDHGFHVFGVYPWSRLLGRGMDEHPLHVLDSCRIGWGTVVSLGDGGTDADHAGVRSQALELREGGLALAEPKVHRVAVRVDGYAAVPDVEVGEEVALHWGRICGRLTPSQLRDVEESTHHRLDVTSRRLRGEHA